MKPVAISLLLTSLLSSPVSYAQGIREVCFSPYGKCDDLVVAEINKAKEVVVMAAFVFTNLKIEAALKAAMARKVRVFMILDQMCLKSKHCKQLGNEVLIYKRDGVMHHKFLIVDEKTLITGSMNFTQAGADTNVENTLVITDPAIVKKYDETFDELRNNTAGGWDLDADGMPLGAEP